MSMIRVNYYLEIYNWVYDIECNKNLTIREFLNEVEQNLNHKGYENLISLESYHNVYLKGQKLEEQQHLSNYLEDLKSSLIIITKDPTKSIESYIPLININDYENLQFYSGNSFKAIDKKTKKTVLIKPLLNTSISHDYKDLVYLRTLFALNHCGIVKILGFRFPLTEEEKKKTKLLKFQYSIKNRNREVDLSKSIIVFEFVENGSIEPILKEYLESENKKHSKLNPTIRSKMIYGIASIMKYVHQKKVIHRDLNVGNVLCDENFEPKIVGFNTAKFENDKDEEERIVGTPYCMAPERIIDSDDIYSYPSDVYSYGFLLFKFFSNNIQLNVKKPIRSSQQYMMAIARGHRPEKPENIPDSYWELIQKCWKQNPKERPTFEQIVEELKQDKFAITEYGMKTNLTELHEYQKRIDSCGLFDLLDLKIENTRLKNQLDKINSVFFSQLNDSKPSNHIIDGEEEKFHQVLSKIGEGATSIAYKVVDTRTGQIMCKKILKYIDNDEISFKILQNAIKEFEILSKINHPSICNAIGINISEIVIDPNISKTKEENKDEENTTVALFLEFADYSLSEYLKNMNNTLKTKIVIEIVHGMKFLHKNGLIHRDLKIENIRLNCVFEAKIIDFGLVRIHEVLSENYSLIQDSMTKGVGTIQYMSPEMLNEEEYDYKTDVYSFGVVLYFIFIGSLPKLSLKDKATGKMIKLPKPSQLISKFCIELISKCLSYEPSKRPSFDEILELIRTNSYSLAYFVDSKIVEKRDLELDFFEK